MVGGLTRGFSHRDAARFSFLLATPVIFAAGVLKVPSLFGPAGKHIHGQVLVGALVAGVASYVSIKWLTKYFETRTLTPFAVYSLVAGVGWIVPFAWPGGPGAGQVRRLPSNGGRRGRPSF